MCVYAMTNKRPTAHASARVTRSERSHACFTLSLRLLRENYYYYYYTVWCSMLSVSVKLSCSRQDLTMRHTHTRTIEIVSLFFFTAKHPNKIHSFDNVPYAITRANSGVGAARRDTATTVFLFFDAIFISELCQCLWEIFYTFSASLSQSSSLSPRLTGPHSPLIFLSSQNRNEIILLLVSLFCCIFSLFRSFAARRSHRARLMKFFNVLNVVCVLKESAACALISILVKMTTTEAPIYLTSSTCVQLASVS